MIMRVTLPMTTSPDFLHFADAVRRRRPRFALILGSGLGHLADRVHEVQELPFHQVPELAAPSIPGHRGALLVGEWAGQPVLIFAGRLHAYEGHPWRRVVQPVHIARALGADMLLVTNAAGGIRADLNPGDLVAIRDHIEWTRADCWQRTARGGPAPIRHACSNACKALRPAPALRCRPVLMRKSPAPATRHGPRFAPSALGRRRGRHVDRP